MIQSRSDLFQGFILKENYRFFLYFIGLLPFIFVGLVNLNENIRLSPDSHSYIRAAVEFVAGNGFGRNYVNWPPVYPMIIALHNFFGLEIISFISVLNKAMYCVVVLVSFYLAYRVFSNKVVAMQFAIIIAIANPVLLIASFVWSELIYILLSLGVFWSWFQFNRESNRTGYLLLLTLLLTMAMMTRYVGLSLLIALLVCCLFSYCWSWKQKVQVFSSLLLSLIPYVAWFLRTRQLTGNFTGPRELSDISLLDCLVMIGDVGAHWLMPHFYFQGKGWVFLFSILLLIAGFSKISSHWGKRVSNFSNDHCSVQQNKHALIYLVTVYVIVYLFVISYTSTHYKIDSIGDRLLSPIYFCIMFFLFLMVDRVASSDVINHFYRFKAKFNFVWLMYLLFWISAPNILITTFIG